MDTHDKALELELAEVSGYLARQLLIDDDDVRVARENRLISVAGEILQRRLYLGEAVGRSPRDIVLYLRISEIADFAVERAGGLFYDNSGDRVLGSALIGVGSIDQVFCGTRELARAALACNASSLVVWHTHPDCFAEPSQADLMHLSNLLISLPVIGLALSDYLIISAGGGYWSAREAGLMSRSAATRLHALHASGGQAWRDRARRLCSYLRLAFIVWRGEPQTRRESDYGTRI
jgi:DNA repair protein RadC